MTQANVVRVAVRPAGLFPVRPLPSRHFSDTTTAVTLHLVQGPTGKREYTQNASYVVGQKVWSAEQLSWMLNGIPINQRINWFILARRMAWRISDLWTELCDKPEERMRLILEMRVVIKGTYSILPAQPLVPERQRRFLLVHLQCLEDAT